MPLSKVAYYAYLENSLKYNSASTWQRKGTNGWHNTETGEERVGDQFTLVNVNTHLKGTIFDFYLLQLHLLPTLWNQVGG